MSTRTVVGLPWRYPLTTKYVTFVGVTLLVLAVLGTIR